MQSLNPYEYLSYLILFHNVCTPRAGRAQSLQRLASGWTVRGSNPGGEARLSSPVKTGPGTHPAFYTVVTGVEPPGRGVDHPLPSSAEVKERVEVYLYSPSRSSRPVLGELHLYVALPFTSDYNLVSFPKCPQRGVMFYVAGLCPLQFKTLRRHFCGERTSDFVTAMYSRSCNGV